MPFRSAAASASGVSVIWWIQTFLMPASAARSTQAAVSSLGSSSTAASTGAGRYLKSGKALSPSMSPEPGSTAYTVLPAFLRAS